MNFAAGENKNILKLINLIDNTVKANTGANLGDHTHAYPKDDNS